MSGLLFLDIDEGGRAVGSAPGARAGLGDDANRLVGKAIGLPTLPVVTIAGPHADSGPEWKFAAVGRSGLTAAHLDVVRRWRV